MAQKNQLRQPWLVAVWPGMGHVALNAGIYLLAKLNMSLLTEFDTGDLFDIENVDVKDGRIEPVRRPRSRLFAWHAENGNHDLLLFLGEAQPPVGKFAFCRQLLQHVRQWNVERVFTFAAMATQMHPQHDSRVFGAATDQENLKELKRLELELLADGNIGGLNGVLLGAAASEGLPGICLLGEMPHIFAQLPFPRASLAILEVFTTIAKINVDLTQLEEQAQTTDDQLGELLARLESAYGGRESGEEEEYKAEPSEIDPKDAETRRAIEAHFQQASQDRSKAFELKQLLDRHGMFKEFEDRFLDLFKRQEKPS